MGTSLLIIEILVIFLLVVYFCDQNFFSAILWYFSFTYVLVTKVGTNQVILNRRNDFTYVLVTK